LGDLAITNVPFQPYCRGGAATTATAAEGDVIPRRATPASSQGHDRPVIGTSPRSGELFEGYRQF
jgi:hypothetical protein